MTTRNYLSKSPPLSLRQKLEALADQRPALRPSIDFAEPGDELAAVEDTLTRQVRALYRLLGARKAAEELTPSRPSLARIQSLSEETARLETIAAQRFPELH